MDNVTVKVPHQLNVAFEHLAAERGLKKSALMREAFVAFIQQNKPSSQPLLLDALGDIVGGVDGCEDLSTNPKYLEGYGE